MYALHLTVISLSRQGKPEPSLRRCPVTDKCIEHIDTEISAYDIIEILKPKADYSGLSGFYQYRKRHIKLPSDIPSHGRRIVIDQIVRLADQIIIRCCPVSDLKDHCLIPIQR